MKKRIILAMSLLILGTAAAAQNQNIVLTPTALYDLIEKQNVKTTKLTHVCLKLNNRVNELERETARLKTASILTHQALNELRKRVVPGVQKQITVLHTKKADK
jgi:hypothetical protein